jgi:hypothetical protein
MPNLCQKFGRSANVGRYGVGGFEKNSKFKKAKFKNANAKFKMQKCKIKMQNAKFKRQMQNA